MLPGNCYSGWSCNMVVYEKEKEGFLGSTNGVWPRAAMFGDYVYVDPNNTSTLIGEVCRMPNDYSASRLPYCETMPDLATKTKCYAQCVYNYPGGIRGSCYPNILKTYNAYSAQLNDPAFPQTMPSPCDETDPCCYPSPIVINNGLFDFLN